MLDTPVSTSDLERHMEYQSYLDLLGADETTTPQIVPELVQIVSNLHLQGQLRSLRECTNVYYIVKHVAFETNSEHHKQTNVG